MEYTKLKFWKETRVLISAIYTVTKRFPKDEIYGLTSQIRRCAVSIPSNIAEEELQKKVSIFFIFLEGHYMN